MTSTIRADFTCDSSLSIMGSNTPPLVQRFFPDASFLANNVFIIYIAPEQNLYIASLNNSNALQTAQNVNVQLFDSGNSLIGGNNTTTATTLGLMQKDQLYYLQITTSTVPNNNTPGVWLFELRGGIIASMDQFFPAGLEDYPLLTGIVRTNLPNGAKTFTFTNVTVTQGQQVALCFADVAIQAGTFSVTVTGSCVGVFAPYQQAFVVNNSVAIIMSALADATISSGTVVVTLTAITGALVNCNLAMIKNSGKFSADPAIVV